MDVGNADFKNRWAHHFVVRGQAEHPVARTDLETITMLAKNSSCGKSFIHQANETITKAAESNRVALGGFGIDLSADL